MTTVSEATEFCRLAFDSLDGSIARGAKLIGATQAVFTLFLSLLIAYPLALLYRFLRPTILRTATRRNLYFASAGVLLCLLNFRLDALHSLLSVFVTFSLCRLMPGSGLAVILGFLFHVTYLTVGYAVVSSEKYDVSWTTAQCVLCLRHIGLLFDLWDGKKESKRVESTSSSSFPAPLKTSPSLLQLVAHTFFFGGFLVGPQFPMARYLHFIDDFDTEKLDRGVDNRDPDVSRPSAVDRSVNGSASTSSSSTILSAMQRLVGGLLYVGVFQVGVVLVPQSYMLTSEFLHQSGFLYKMSYILIWGKIVLYKYVGCWLIAEGSCILSGLTYNGLDENGNILWNSCANIEIAKYESADTFRGIIASFNVNTNKWVQNYIFKRLKFLGSKALSAVSSLFFLALWHGVFSGYFMCFALEFVVLKFETDIQDLKNKIPTLSRTWTFLPEYVRFLIGKWFTLQFLGYALVSFCLLSLPRWTAVYASVYYVGHIIFFAWILVAPLAQSLVKSKKDDVKQKDQ